MSVGSKQDSRSLPPRSNWSATQRVGSMYALSLVDISTIDGPRVRSVSDRLQSNKSGLEAATTTFVFTMSPKSMNMDEPAAVTIVPTQGGQFVEHQGQIYKNISLSGTTGLRPNAQSSGIVIPIAGIRLPGSDLGSNDNGGLPSGERSGFDDFITLRNLFRLYWDLKDDPELAPTTVMVWQNGKEGEYYIVEPMTFRTNRDAGAPLTFSYDIQLRTIDKFDASKLGNRTDPMKAQRDTALYLKRIGDIKRMLASSFTTAQALVDRTINIGKATINDILSPVSMVLDGLSGVVSSGRQVFDIPQTALSTIASSATDLAVQLDKVPNNSYVQSGTTSQIAIAAHAYREISRQLLRLQGETQLFSTQISATVSTKRQAYSNGIIGLPLTGGSPTDLGNVKVASGAASTVVNVGDTIRSIAQRVMGDAAQWKILVLLNSLQAPYISASGDGVSVLRPGDQILYPRSPGAPDALVATTQQNELGTQNALDRLGRDFKLTVREATAGIVVYDLEKDQRGDIARVERLENLQQAVTIKLATEQGELPTHEWFGLRAPIGSKAAMQSLINFQINVRATLQSDNRIETVLQANVGVEGNVMRVRAAARVKDFDQPLTINHAVQR